MKKSASTTAVKLLEEYKKERYIRKIWDLLEREYFRITLPNE